LAMSRAMIRGYQAEWNGALGLFVNELSEDGNEER